MFGLKMVQSVSVSNQRRVKRGRWLKSTAVRVFCLVLYVELCFCTGYILAYKREMNERTIVAYTQVKVQGSVHLQK